MNLDAIIESCSLAIKRAIPESALTVTDWADTYRFLAAERAAISGRWQTDRVPYLKGIMDAVTRPDVREIVFMKSSQVGGSEVANNIIGYFVHIEPSPILYVCESEGKAQAWSKESLAPMIRDTPVLNELFEAPRERDSGNTISGKRFPGGHLAVAWATSAAQLSSRPRRIVIFDEVDGFGTTSEGDPISLAEARTKTFSDAKIIKISSPRDEDTSRIKPAYQSSWAGKYFVPCPHCGTYQTIEWARIKWDENPLDAYLICEAHGCVIENDDKFAMLQRGQWRHGLFTDVTDEQGHVTRVWNEGGELRGTIGFHVWEGYSPFVAWGDLALNFLKKKNKLDELRAFVNTSLGQTWEQRETEIEVGTLPDRCEEYEAEVPAGVLVLTAGVDVQGNRLEYEIVGWGRDGESWSIYYGRIEGDPAQRGVWEDLQAELGREFEGVDGRKFRVQCAAIDSGGHHTNEVYAFCRLNRGRRWYAIKGANTSGKPLISKPSLQGNPPVKLFTVGTETAKDTFSNQLNVLEPGPNYCHFPALFDEVTQQPIYDEAYFKMLVSEHSVKEYSRGVARRVWRKIRASARNEALDCRVYAMAALNILHPNMDAIAANHAPRTPSDSGASGENQRENVEKSNFVPRIPRNARGGGFIGGWR